MSSKWASGLRFDVVWEVVAKIIVDVVVCTGLWIVVDRIGVNRGPCTPLERKIVFENIVPKGQSFLPLFHRPTRRAPRSSLPS